MNEQGYQTALTLAEKVIAAYESIIRRQESELREVNEELDRLRGLVTFGGTDAAGDVVLGVPVAQPVDEQLEREWRAQFPTEQGVGQGVGCGDDACGLCACGERPPF